MTTDSKPWWSLTFQEELFLFSSLMLVTCFFLPWRAYESPSNYLMSAGYNTHFWWFIFMVVCLTPLMLRVPQLRPWAGIFTALCVTVALVASTGGAGQYGAQLARFFALGMLVLSANPAVIRATDFGMKRLNSQKAEVSSHWGTALAGTQFSAKEYYVKIEQAIQARDWPGVEMLRVLHSEAGLLSHKREYLRVVRQRQVFDICAATFGKDYFFTLREAEIQPPLSLATFLIFLLTLFLLFTWSVSIFGSMAGALNFVGLIAIGFFLMFNALRMGLTRLDGLFMRWPVIGPIYETFFRRSTTYFQHDTRMVFLKLMDELVKEHVDEETSANGIKLLSCFEHQPIFDDFYKVSEHMPKGGDVK